MHLRKRGGERRFERDAPKPPDQATRIHSDEISDYHYLLPSTFELQLPAAARADVWVSLVAARRSAFGPEEEFALRAGCCHRS